MQSAAAALATDAPSMATHDAAAAAGEPQVGSASDSESDTAEHRPPSHKRGSLAAPEQQPEPLDIVLTTPLDGFLAPRAEIELLFHFEANAVGTVRDTYRVHYDDADAEDMLFTMTAQSCHVPVYLSETSLDLRTCMVDHEYFGHFLVHNARPTGASKITLSVPAAARGLIDLKPRSGLVAAKGTLKVEIAFTPKPGIVEQLQPEQMADGDSGRVAVPLTLQAEGQSRDGTLLVCAHVTPAHIEVSADRLDFGRVSTHESAVRRIRLTNHSALPQPFGFTGLPSWLTVQPGDGFGTLLPFESLVCDVVFSPSRHPHDDDAQKFQTTIAVEYRGRETARRIRVTGTGIAPALVLSSNHLTFQPTCIGDETSATMLLRNTSGTARVYQVAIPKNAPVEVSPVCAEIPPHGQQLLWLRFAPTLAEWELRPPTPVEVSKTPKGKVKLKKPIKTKEMLAEEERVAREKEEARVGALRAALPLVQRVNLPFYVKATRVPYATDDPHHEDERQGGTEHTMATRRGQDIACDETLQLALALPMCEPLVQMAPAAAAVAAKGSGGGGSGGGGVVAHCHDYGQVALGVRVQHTFTVRNMSPDEAVELSASPPGPAGAFFLTRALRPIPPGGEGSVTFAFAPSAVGAYFEVAEVTCTRGKAQQRLRLKLYGEGVRCSLEVKLPKQAKHARRVAECSGVPPPAPRSLLFSDCAVGGARVETIVLHNTSPFALPFNITVLSTATGRNGRNGGGGGGNGGGGGHQQERGRGTPEGAAWPMPAVVYDPVRVDAVVQRPPPDAAAVDVDNLGPVSAFSVSVVEGVLASEATREVAVKFCPDRPSLDYRATMVIAYGETRAQEEALDLRGRAWQPGAFVCGFDRVDVPEADNMLSFGNLFSAAAAAAAEGGGGTAGVGEGGADGAGSAAADAAGGAGGDADAAAGAADGSSSGEMNAKQAAAVAAAAASSTDAMANRITLVYSVSGKQPAELSHRDIAVGVTSLEVKKKTNLEVVFEPLSAQARAMGFDLVGALKSTADQDTPSVMRLAFSPPQPEAAASIAVDGGAKDKDKAVVALKDGGAGAGAEAGGKKGRSRADATPRSAAGKEAAAAAAAGDGSGAPAAVQVGVGSVVHERLALTARMGSTARVFPFEVVLHVVE